MTKQRLALLVSSLIIFLFASLVSTAQDISTDAAVIKSGEALFNANCKTCHRRDQKLIGPALAGVHTRVPSMDWLKAWIRNPAKVIASGDEYAVKIYAEYNSSQMTAFTSLTDDQIMSILAYVNAPIEVAPTVATGGPTQGAPGVPKAYFDALLVGMIIILVLLLVVLLLIVSALKRFLTEKNLTEADKEIVESPYSVGSFISSPGFIFLVVFVVAAVSFKTVIDGLYSVGVQQGYAPKQPIAFSHKIHAGEYEIDCKYCHTGAMKGKQANIPSPNICMNCHSQIKSGEITGEGEIGKIYAAVGFDPATSKYTGEQKPIEWVRIHNLPDLAYFNHSQHVNVAGVECQTCHGPIQEMDVVRQHSLLTMGWCIDCHRKTDVNTKGNAYYDKLEELHKASRKGNMKVEDIGGLECAKCHY